MFWRLGIAIVLCVTTSSPVLVSALTWKPGDKIKASDQISLNTHSYFYWESQPNICAYYAAGATGPVSTSQVQTDNAKTIMGIAKTDNLSESAALIGLMVGLDESTLTNLANQNVPLSEQNPNKQGDGHNGTSLGVFQQQIADNWSTISSNINDVNAIGQLMTPAYAAEAFFGSPPGSSTPSSALKKGLQNKSNWQTIPPWEAAQEVQVSADPTGLVYKAEMGRAQSLLDQYWSSATAVPLPVPVTGGTSGTTTQTINCSTPGAAGVGGYKNPFRSVQKLKPERIDQGVDYAGEGTVYALGNGTIVNVTNSGWCFGDPTGPGACAFIVDKLSDGPAAGQYSYMSEECTPLVKIGQVVTPDTPICTMSFPDDTGIETGWAEPPGNGAAYAAKYGEFNGSNSTAFGNNYNQLLVALGAPSGVPQGGTPGPLPPNWPTWGK